MGWSDHVRRRYDVLRILGSAPKSVCPRVPSPKSSCGVLRNTLISVIYRLLSAVLVQSDSAFVNRVIIGLLYDRSSEITSGSPLPLRFSAPILTPLSVYILSAAYLLTENLHPPLSVHSTKHKRTETDNAGIRIYLFSVAKRFGRQS